MKQSKTKRGWVAQVLCAMAATGALIGALIGALMGAPGAAMAQSNERAQSATQTQAPVRADEVGHSTLAWLALQRSNTEAAPALPMLGAEAGLAYRRYMESFKSKIPDLYGSALKAGGVGDAGSGGATQGSSGSGAN